MKAKDNHHMAAVFQATGSKLFTSRLEEAKDIVKVRRRERHDCTLSLCLREQMVSWISAFRLAAIFSSVAINSCLSGSKRIDYRWH